MQNPYNVSGFEEKVEVVRILRKVLILPGGSSSCLGIGIDDSAAQISKKG